MDRGLQERLELALAEVSGVRLAFLFGSRARGQQRTGSDFDIAVLVDPERAREPGARLATIRRLAGRLGRAISSTALDLVLLNDAPALLRHRVIRDGHLLFARSVEERVRFVTETLREHQDGEIRRRWFLQHRIADLTQGRLHGRPGDLLQKARRTARLLGEAEGFSDS
jgi:hypothetical protein